MVQQIKPTRIPKRQKNGSLTNAQGYQLEFQYTESPQKVDESMIILPEKEFQDGTA